MIGNPWNEKELEADPELIVVGKDGNEEVEESKIFPACFCNSCNGNKRKG